MEDDRNCRLKISVENVNSEDDGSSSEASSCSGAEEEETSVSRKKADRRSPAAALERQSSTDDGRSADEDSDHTAISVLAVDPIEKPKLPEPRIKTYKNEAGTFVVGFDVASEECFEKQKLRAKRFGDAVSSLSTITEEAIQKLYESLGVSPSSDNGENIVRFDAVHIRGVDEMSTSRIFSYFREFAPAAIEWIDDTSCNVVWLDTMMAVRALLKLSYDSTSSENPASDSMVASERDGSKDDVAPTSDSSDRLQPAAGSMVIEIEDDDLNLLSDDDIAKLSHSTVTAEENLGNNPKLSRNSREEEDMDVDEDVVAKRQPNVEKQSSRESKIQKKKIQKIHMNENEGKLPPGKWRIGIPHPRARHLFMRFATKDDVKQQGAGKRSKYYQKYGNPNFGGIKGIISESRKRKAFSKQYHIELEEARKAIEEAKWKRGVPDETKFDRHIEEAALRREQRKRNPVEFIHSSDDSEGSSSELVVEPIDAPKRKRFMKMHADEVEERNLSGRLGSCNYPSSKSDVWSRLGVGSQSVRTVDNSRHKRSSRRFSGDLRNHLNRR